MKVTVTLNVDSSKEVDKVLDTIFHIQNKYGEKICKDNKCDTFNWGMLTAWVYEIKEEVRRMENDIL